MNSSPRQDAGADLEVFDIAGPLPSGTTILEASAGTGKTWAIAALVARQVAEGLALDKLLVVTFSRAATQELRERVRERLIRTELTLRHAIAGTDPPHEVDRLDHAVLRDAVGQAWPVDELQIRQRRLRDALGAFDNATIATIHQFCQSVLRGLGVAGDIDPGTTLVEDLSELIGQVVDDVYLARYRRQETPPFSHAIARAIATAVTGDSAAVIGPTDADADSLDAERVRFGEAVRAELAVRKRRLGILSYDDLLQDLAAALADPQAPARERMRQRWSVILVDEFQDTDPVQWQVLERAFHQHRSLTLIGDPKQAIYAFRGGDINTYLRARDLADHRLTLGTNFRSDAPLVAALSAGLHGMTLGNPHVLVRPVAARHAHSRLQGMPNPAPWRLRVADRSRLGLDPNQLARIGETRPVIAADCAADIARVLASSATFDGRPIRPGDIAVLCANGLQLREVRDALAQAGVPAVLPGDESVFASNAARWWLTLLEAMAMPNRSGRVRAAALTPFIGVEIADLDGGGDALTDRHATRLRRWAELFALRGIPAVLTAAESQGVTERLLHRPDGERALTDVRHLAQLLHTAVLQHRFGITALTAWLREQIDDDRPNYAGERSRRLESDAAAVQLSTIHASKGLQFPIVYAPFLFDRHDTFERPSEIALLRYHDTAARRVIHIGSSVPPEVLDRARTEDEGESLRLLYVALTRAQSGLVTWWAPTYNTPTSPLHRTLFGRAPGGWGEPESPVPLPSDRALVDQLEAWARAGGPRPEPMTADRGLLPPPPPDPSTPLRVRTFTRTIDEHWRRTSYSALTKVTAGTHALPPPSEPETPGKDDEAPAAELLGLSTPEEIPDIPSPMADLPVGATFGNLVHAVLEAADVQADDLRAEFLREIAIASVRWPVELSAANLADALIAVVTTPLGTLAPGTTLADIGRADRLCELDFELPLDGGDQRRAGSEVRLGDLAPLLRAHLGSGDPLLAYASALEDPDLGDQVLRGYLTGSVDVVLRVGGRYLVVDYKTNWLGAPDVRLTSAHYGPQALIAAMQHSSYPLQALLYAVVLHRFLRWRLPDYNPGSHLGGVLYLYLRGMCGPDTPVIGGNPTGVFSWQPPPQLVIAISDLLDGSSAS